MKLLPVGVSIEEFENAFTEALKLYGNTPIEISKRIRLVVSTAFGKGEHLLDIGSYVNIYPVVLRLLGMEITILDSFPQRRLPGESEKINYILENVYKKVGINIIQEDVYDVSLPQNMFDRISAFEVFEHLVDSPRPILEKIYHTLRPGGLIIISVPNIVKLANRLLMSIGHSHLHKYSDYFEKGNPFLGHRREMTTREVRWMLARSGFEVERIFTTNIIVPDYSWKNYSLIKKARILLIRTISQLVPNFRAGIYAIGWKPLTTG